MSLQNDIFEIQNSFDSVSSDKFLEVLTKIKPELKSQLTSEYLQGKIDKVKSEPNEAEKKKICKSLMPYLDWYEKGQ